MKIINVIESGMMTENDQELTLSLLKTIFTEFKNSLDHIYKYDSVFREIAADYKECIDKHESIFKEKGEWSDLFTETINELKEELLAYLNSIKSDNFNIDEKQENQV